MAIVELHFHITTPSDSAAIINAVNMTEKRLMAEIQEVHAEIAAAAADVVAERAEVAAKVQALNDQIVALAVQIEDLKAQLGNGTNVTGADLDTALESIKALRAGIQAIYVEPPVTPEPKPEPEPTPEPEPEPAPEVPVEPAQ